MTDTINTSFLSNLGDSKIDFPPILVVDSSGSVRMLFDSNMTIFNKIEQVCKNINADIFRCIFWNSNIQNSNNTFLDGILNQ